MEDVIDQLRERNEPVPVPLELPDDDLLVEIEEALCVALPDDLRLYLLLVSDVVCGHLEPVTVTDPNSHTYLPEVAAVAWSLGMPRRYLPVCEYEGGYYCMGHDGEVRYWQETMSEETWESLWHWVRDVWLAD
ncbi:MAG: SMI1/KNR4 family protein [Pseudomonadales bacterium]|nr:SMI1/KNR4 family protein [Pseudomonadales bacterium]MCP5358955.1 SMI1/KNR4 family protein [Pseudomonadales bacterium]